MADSDDEDEEEFANADTYANYVPTKGMSDEMVLVHRYLHVLLHKQSRSA